MDTYNLKPNADLRAEGRTMLDGSWWPAVAVCLVASLIVGAASSVPLGSFVIGGAFELGLVIYFINLNRRRESDFNDLFKGFDLFGKTIGLFLLTGLFAFLWSLLFIIPGIIAAYRYSQAFYLLADNPELTVSEAIDESKRMMDGAKWKLFCLHLSFIGWAILCVFTLGIGALFLTPYVKASETAFYEDLRRNDQKAGYQAEYTVNE